MEALVSTKKVPWSVRGEQWPKNCLREVPGKCALPTAFGWWVCPQNALLLEEAKAARSLRLAEPCALVFGFPKQEPCRAGWVVPIRTESSGSWAAALPLLSPLFSKASKSYQPGFYSQASACVPGTPCKQDKPQDEWTRRALTDHVPQTERPPALHNTLHKKINSGGILLCNHITLHNKN